MLTKEQAEAALKQFEIPNWEKQRVTELLGLGPHLAEIGKHLLARRIWGSTQEDDPAEALDRLKANERTAIFEVLFPSLGQSLEQMWSAGTALPYQWGWTRRAFRAPRHPELTRDARLSRLVKVVQSLRGYAPDPVWVARWAPYLEHSDGLGAYLAAVIDRDRASGPAVFDLLLQSARGEDEIGAMGRHITTTFLTCSRPDGWAFVENALLGAQREEGFRQSVLEAVDEAHPEAFRRMLDLIVSHDLGRFSSTVRALDVWLGLMFAAGSAGAVKKSVSSISAYLKDDDARSRALASGNAEQIYLGLWCEAFADAMNAIPLAGRFLKHADPEIRFVSAHLLLQLHLGIARKELGPLLDDPDLRVAAHAMPAWRRGSGWDLSKDPDKVFERLARLYQRVPKDGAELNQAVWPWTAGKLERKDVGNALVNVSAERRAIEFAPFIGGMEPYERYVVAQRLENTKKFDAETRRFVLSLLADPSHEVREPALAALSTARITPADAPELERLLARKAPELRRGIVGLLQGLADRECLASADRLLSDGSDDRRAAGLELLRRLKESNRLQKDVRQRAESYGTGHPAAAEGEQIQLRALLEESLTELPSLGDALGLAPVDSRSGTPTPQARKVRRASEPAAKLLLDLDEFVHSMRNVSIALNAGLGQTHEELLGNIQYGFPEPAMARASRVLLDAPSDPPLPLRDEWLKWEHDRTQSTRDPDGFDLARAFRLTQHMGLLGWKPLKSPIDGVAIPTLRYALVVRQVLLWLVKERPSPGTASFVLDAAESALAGVSREDIALAREHKETKRPREYLHDLELARIHRRLVPAQWSPDNLKRLWGLLRWVDETDLHIAAPFPRMPGVIVVGSDPSHQPAPRLEEIVTFFAAGVATEGDVLTFLLNPGNVNRAPGAVGVKLSFVDLGEVSRRHPRRLVASDQRLLGLVKRARTRIVEIELKRGESPTAASAAAAALRYSGALEALIPLLGALGREGFVRGWAYDGVARTVVLSHLIRVALPSSADTPAEFARHVRDANIPTRRLVELAAFSPHWAAHVEAAVDWRGLASAVWWMHAHTKERGWLVDADIRELWKGEIAERTALSSEDLLDGAVDTRWFFEVYSALGPERWESVDSAAKYTSSGGGHTRARLFADALRGALTEAELTARIDKKRQQDAVRALGLLPIPGNLRDETILRRYKAIQEFRRGARKFGSARQASEKRAADIALENLARTAGYPDPIRLGWAMEAKGVADVASGGKILRVGDVEITLTLGDLGHPELAIKKAGRAVKAIPAALKRDPEVVALRERQAQLRRDASRSRESLESAMIRGDEFTGSELRELLQHGLLAPMLRRLLLVGESFAGYPAESGRVLEDYAARREAVAPDERLRIAHPVDLFATKAWSQWQRECFTRERVQPFKQIFRELYLPTRDETESRESSRRYAGHQVQPRQALALLGSRGWVSLPEEGVRRTFHGARLTAWLTFVEGFFSPAEIDGLTIEEVRFSPPGTFDVVPIVDVPPRIFSEVMRDLDLVVSVAHMGGVDPESTASSIEMRAVLVKETAQLLGLNNVRTEGPRALVDGKLGSYNVHMGSGVIHRQPGGALFVVPVHSQYRGRIFLPFADDDPKSAEVLSKVLLLARDYEIKDPSILEQIRGTA